MTQWKREHGREVDIAPATGRRCGSRRAKRCTVHRLDGSGRCHVNDAMLRAEGHAVWCRAHDRMAIGQRRERARNRHRGALGPLRTIRLALKGSNGAARQHVQGSSRIFDRRLD